LNKYGLRVEFFKNYQKPLNPESFITATQSSDSVKDGDDLMEACQYLRNQKLTELLKVVENFEVAPMHSLSLSMVRTINSIIPFRV
jgi:hypothetical protein